jgi:hypothetical protein
MVLGNPAITVDELLVVARRHGQCYKRSSVIMARQQALEMINATKELGHWKD